MKYKHKDVSKLNLQQTDNSLWQDWLIDLTQERILVSTITVGLCPSGNKHWNAAWM